jgi:two-component system nitrate/nitrite response regulator NarL
LVASRPIRPSQDLFVSPSGNALPRWLKAFPTATSCRPGAISGTPPVTALVWLRLDPAIPALDQLAALRRSVGEARVIVLANYPDNEEALALFSSGIRGYCNAHATAANLRQIANVVREGGLWIGEALMQRLLVATQAAMWRRPADEATPGVTAGATTGASTAPLAVLTGREQEVARAVANGSSNKEIARQMGITERTIKAHASSIFQKLKARDRLHLALIVNGHRPA